MLITGFGKPMVIRGFGKPMLTKGVEKKQLLQNAYSLQQISLQQADKHHYFICTALLNISMYSLRKVSFIIMPKHILIFSAL